MKFVQLLAYEAFKDLKCLKKKQSIIITGVSGSGKTESGKHILDFLCQVKSDTQNVIVAAPIFEAFGNARTRANANSSRYCKLVEVFHFFFLYIIVIDCHQSILFDVLLKLVYDADFKQFGAKICYNLLESNRVFTAKPNESNFHVFYVLILGAPNEILNDIGLYPQTSYKVCKIDCLVSPGFVSIRIVRECSTYDF